MTAISLIGDGATTTALAMCATWPADGSPTIVELDPTGGSVGGWLDTPLEPSISTLVTRSRRTQSVDADAIESLVHRTASGIDAIVAPVRATEAWRATAEADPLLADAVAAGVARDLFIDHGRPDPRHSLPTSLVAADIVVVGYRQPMTTRAAAVRVERLIETVERITRATDAPIAVAVIGDVPFEPSDVCAFVGDGVGRDVECTPLPEDGLAAAVLAGRPGVSPRRFARMPLIRAAQQLSDTVRSARERRDGPVPIDAERTT
ncbi:MAG: hypothetical protein AAGF73_00590 [Actinomycetota bacterium]